MRIEKITSTNLKLAISLVNKIFKSKWDRETAIFWYKEFIKPDFKRKWQHLRYLTYQIVYDENKPIGLTGFYVHKEQPNDAWLSWFGIVPEERRKGLGSKVLMKTMRSAKKFGINFKLFTEPSDEEAITFYKANRFRKCKKETAVMYKGKVIVRYPKNAIFYCRSFRTL